MRRDWREPKPSRMFRGSELPRLLAGLLMLALLLLLFNRLRNPDMWTWFAPNAPSSTAAGKTEDAKGSPTAAAIRAATDEPQSTPRSTGQTREKTPSESPPPRDLDKEATDQDPDEAREAAMEYQAITDGTLELQREEMVHYNRIVRWVQNQSFDTLLHRARSDLIFRQLYQSPDKYRGKLVALDLNVRQVLDVGESENGVQLWEVVGWTTESNAWLYWTIVLDLPKGMPTGPNVSERARFVGYLFKLQGYHEAGAKPNAPPLKAPLLIGRLEWKPAEAAASGDTASETTWGLVLLAVVGALIGLRFVYGALRRRPRTMDARVRDPSTGTAVPIETWLDRQEHEGDHGESRSTGTDEPPDDGRPGGDGQPRDAGPLSEQLDES